MFVVEQKRFTQLHTKDLKPPSDTPSSQHGQKKTTDGVQYGRPNMAAPIYPHPCLYDVVLRATILMLNFIYFVHYIKILHLQEIINSVLHTSSCTAVNSNQPRPPFCKRHFRCTYYLARTLMLMQKSLFQWF